MWHINRIEQIVVKGIEGEGSLVLRQDSYFTAHLKLHVNRLKNNKIPKQKGR